MEKESRTDLLIFGFGIIGYLFPNPVGSIISFIAGIGFMTGYLLTLLKIKQRGEN